MKKIIGIILAIALFIGGLFLGYSIFKPEAPTQRVVNADTVLTMLQGEGFFVSQTYVFNHTAEILDTTGSRWKDILWRQYTEASANVKVSSGVDLSKLQAEDVSVTSSRIEIILPELETYSVEIIDGINLENKEGLLKRIFDHDDGYNTALEELKLLATASAEEEELRTEAKENAVEEVSRIIRFVQPDKEVVVKFADQ